MRFNNHLNEQISKDQLNDLEKVLDGLFKTLDIDIEFTKHFFDRVNDKRNGKDITIPELNALFRKTFVRYGQKLVDHGEGLEAVLDDLQTNINVPFVLQWNERSRMIELVSKTVMRKKGFTVGNTPRLKL